MVWFTLVIFFLFTLQSYIFLDKHLAPPMMSLAKVRLKQLATQSINTAITDGIGELGDVDRLIDWKTDNNGKVTGFMLNYSEHMRITANTIKRVQSLLNGMKRMPEHIPIGQALKSPILASFGPDIPIRLVPQGAAQVELSTRYQNAGINMILVEVYIRIIAEVSIIIPFDSAPEIVETELPISYVLVVGDTPMYYLDNKGNPIGNSNPLPPSISLPNLQQQESGSTGVHSTFPLSGSGTGTGESSLPAGGS
ncbi:sporulation protein YunB [Gorillibacterium massiliense]|uniref:sporulation protein YunB n=1 Tax=Gorillibacterium massiliense TaxID=1280390 RepID=UPI0004B92359|nr:sporulation protein YunB [Gorillibacterium massiliense]